MGRNLIRSDYAAGTPAWIDWVAVGFLLLSGLRMVFTGGNLFVAVPILLSGFGFGVFVTAAEFGILRPSDRS